MSDKMTYPGVPCRISTVYNLHSRHHSRGAPLCLDLLFLALPVGCARVATLLLRGASLRAVEWADRQSGDVWLDQL